MKNWTHLSTAVAISLVAYAAVAGGCAEIAPSSLVHHDAGTTSDAPDASDNAGSDEPIDFPPPPDWSEDGGAPTPVPPPVSTADAAAPPHDRFASAQTCSGCHPTIYAQWSKSMHSRGLTSPLMIAQTNQVVATPLAGVSNPDPQKICVNCHGPTAAAITQSSTLPLASTTHGDEGVSCTGCHQFNGNPTSGGGGLSTSYIAGLVDGTTYYGPISDPAAAGAHASAPGVAFQQKNLTCANCHNVSLDLNHDHKIVKGQDLVLQQTFDEYSDYRKAGGTETCTTCHMPVIAGLTKAADGTSVTASPREVHDHSFVGTDYALDDAAQESAQRAAREALLKSAGHLSIDRNSINKNNGLSFSVTLENTSSGHNLPTGFGFARQMWLEVVITQGAKQVFVSGLLANPTDDLCDASTLDEDGNPMRRFIQGCPQGSDKSLLSFQTKLVDRVTPKLDANGNKITDDDGQPILVQDDRGKEVFLQYLRGGPVARVRPSDNTAVTALQPFEKRSFGYKAQIDASQPLTVSVRLLFRHLPPYFVRALADGQPAAEVPKLAPLVPNIRIVEMATDKIDLN